MSSGGNKTDSFQETGANFQNSLVYVPHKSLEKVVSIEMQQFKSFKKIAFRCKLYAKLKHNFNFVENL